MQDLHNFRKIFLLRHCHPRIHEHSRMCIGKKDIPLSVNGRKEAKILGEYLTNKNINSVYSSPLKRAHETASIITDGRINVRKNIAELDMGIWDGLSFDEIKLRYPKEYEERGNDFENYIVEGGESISNCRKRAMEELYKTIDESEGNILVVTHAGVIRSIISAIFKTSIKETFEYKIGYGSITLITIDNDELKIIKIGDLDYMNTIKN